MNEYPRTNRTVRVAIEVIPEEGKIMGLFAYLIAFLIGATFVGVMFLAVIKLDWFIFGVLVFGVIILCFAIGIPIADSLGIRP